MDGNIEISGFLGIISLNCVTYKNKFTTTKFTIIPRLTRYCTKYNNPPYMAFIHYLTKRYLK